MAESIRGLMGDLMHFPDWLQLYEAVSCGRHPKLPIELILTNHFMIYIIYIEVQYTYIDIIYI